jgi:hypothetical protein
VIEGRRERDDDVDHHHGELVHILEILRRPFSLINLEIGIDLCRGSEAVGSMATEELAVDVTIRS